MQHPLMQMQQQQQQPMVMTTDHIQQYLDENKWLILKILENQNSGKLSENAENQARLQQNLMYLAAIADCQPQMSFVFDQPGANIMQHQRPQQMTTQSVSAAQSPTLYAQQQPHLALQQQQALHNQFGFNFAVTTGIPTQLSETNGKGSSASRVADGASNQGVGSSSSMKHSRQ
ncbi:unnamed protein product [Camellia sinensis]